MKVTIEDVEAALNRFANTSRDKLGGSDLRQRVGTLVEAGNFGGNSGVAALANATSNEDKLRATVQLIDKALESGQRLAALDISEKAFGPAITDRLRANSGFLDQMLETAQKIEASKIVSDQQVGQAIELKNRLEEAQKILGEKFKPIQDDLAKLGVNYHESWIGIVETMSSAVTQANSLYDAIKRIPDIMAQLGNAPFWSRLTEATGRLGLNSDPGLILKGEPGYATDPAQAKLAAAMQNPSAVRQAMQRAIDVQTAVRGDTSKAPQKPEPEESRDQFEVVIDSINKHIATLNADTAATFQNNAARQQFRAEFQALTAIMRDEGEVTQEQINKYEKLRQSMTAQQALEASGIVLTKEHSEAFLAASTNIGLAATAADKAKDSLNKINSASATMGSALSTAFGDAVFEAKNLNDVVNNLLKTLGKASINSFFASVFNGPSAGGLSPFASFFGLGSIGKNAEGTDNWRGGLTWVGEKGPELLNLPRGAQIVPNDVATRSQAGGSILNNFMVAGDVSQSTIERLQAAIVAAHKQIAGMSKIISSTQRMQTTGVG
ncbi:MAG: hypothetical protein J0H42_04170 [Rhizobiales bacterium]|nr:hypothetical protein [Hyphomicrobiales bacterium]